MQLVNKTNQMEEAYNRYKRSNLHTVWHAYANPSKRKEDAWEYCKDLCNGLCGRDLRVIGHNSFKFSAGFTFKQDGHDYFMYITDFSDKAMRLN